MFWQQVEVGRPVSREAVAAAAPRWDLTREVVTTDMRGNQRF